LHFVRGHRAALHRLEAVVGTFGAKVNLVESFNREINLILLLRSWKIGSSNRESVKGEHVGGVLSIYPDVAVDFFVIGSIIVHRKRNSAIFESTDQVDSAFLLRESHESEVRSGDNVVRTRSVEEIDAHDDAGH